MEIDLGRLVNSIKNRIKNPAAIIAAVATAVTIYYFDYHFDESQKIKEQDYIEMYKSVRNLTFKTARLGGCRQANTYPEADNRVDERRFFHCYNRESNNNMSENSVAILFYSEWSHQYKEKESIEKRSSEKGYSRDKAIRDGCREANTLSDTNNRVNEERFYHCILREQGKLMPTL